MVPTSLGGVWAHATQVACPPTQKPCLTPWCAGVRPPRGVPSTQVSTLDPECTEVPGVSPPPWRPCRWTPIGASLGLFPFLAWNIPLPSPADAHKGPPAALISHLGCGVSCRNPPPHPRTRDGARENALAVTSFELLFPTHTPGRTMVQGRTPTQWRPLRFDAHPHPRTHDGAGEDAHAVASNDL